MSRTEKYDPWEKVRKPIPAPGGPMKSRKEYRRSQKEEEDRELIEEGLEEYFEEYDI